MALSIVQGNLLDAPETFIGHQCNCVTAGKGKGLAKVLFAKFPYANVYAQRQEASKPGTYSLHGNGVDARFVVNLYGQYNPGLARRKHDNQANRLNWLVSALDQFIAEVSPEDLALPFGIGCGLAGGNWGDYLTALDSLSERCRIDLRLYQYAP